MEHAVGAERQHAAVVVGKGLGHLQDDPLAGGVGMVGVVRTDGEAGDDGAPGCRCGVVDVEVAVGGVVGVEGEAEEALLVAAVADPVTDVQEHRGRLDGLVVGEEHDTAGLEKDEEPVGAVSGVGQIDHTVKSEVGKGGRHVHGDEGTGRLLYDWRRC